MEPGDTSPPPRFEPADLIGTLFADRFEVGRLASTGANTAIFDAVDNQSGRMVTLKLVRPKLAASPTFRNKFDETMRAVAALSHPNIAAVYDWGMARVGDSSTAYVVNEYLSGGSLRDMFDRGRRLSPSQALAVGLDVCRALDHAHRRRFVHTELSPSKIVFGDDRRLRIIDFGLARLLGAASWERPDSVPTHVAWYAAPEQGLGLPVDGHADVYALALSLHEAVTGVLPFKSDSTVAALSNRVGKLMPVSADLGPLASVLEHAGRPDADERSTAAEFGKGLLQVASKLPRPEPLPLLSSGLFDTPADQLRSPDDPTGGVVRRPGEQPPAAILLVPLDEPTPEVPDADGDTGTAGAVSGEPVDVTTELAGPNTVEPGTVDPSTVEPGTVEPGTVEPAVGLAAAGVVSRGLDDPPIVPSTDSTAESQLPAANPGEELVILPLDAAHEPAPAGATAQIASVAPGVAEVESMPRRRRRFPWKILMGLLVIAALVALAVLATQLFKTPSYLVPELTGMPEAEARNQIAANEWEVSVEHERSDEIPVAGQVVRTAPAAGVELAEGEPFLIVVSDGPLLRQLPDPTGKTVLEAQTELDALQLGTEVVEQPDEVVLPGIVISWSVPGDATLTVGSLVEPATVVQLVVSNGPAPRIVPNLVGLASSDAQAQIEGAGLTFAVVDQVFSDDVPIGVVTSQDIPEGTQVVRGSGVTVVVSKGPDLVTYPDISAAVTYDEAAAILVAAGFQPVLTFGDAQGAIQTVSIDGSDPVVGTTYRRGTVVEFTAL